MANLGCPLDPPGERDPQLRTFLHQNDPGALGKESFLSETVSFNCQLETTQNYLQKSLNVGLSTLGWSVDMSMGDSLN